MLKIRKLRLLTLIPALVWILTQFAMTGALAATGEPRLGDRQRAALVAVGVERVTICGPAGLVEIDTATGLPVDEAPAHGEHCKWCQGFGVLTIPNSPADAAPVSITPEILKFRDIAQRAVRRIGANSGFSSRAPPV